MDAKDLTLAHVKSHLQVILFKTHNLFLDFNSNPFLIYLSSLQKSFLYIYISPRDPETYPEWDGEYRFK